VHVPFYEVPDRLAELPTDRTLYVYCGSGYRAAAVVSLLKGHGFRDAVHVDDDWDNARPAGLDVVAEQPGERTPGWTWLASRAAVRTFGPAATSGGTG